MEEAADAQTVMMVDETLSGTIPGRLSVSCSRWVIDPRSCLRSSHRRLYSLPAYAACWQAMLAVLRNNQGNPYFAVPWSGSLSKVFASRSRFMRFSARSSWREISSVLS